MSDETCQHAFAVDLPANPCLKCGKQLVPKTQPLPTPGEGDIMLALETRVRQRREKGIAMYGRSLQAFNGRRALVDALEEAVDLAAYLEQELHERAKLEARVAGAAQSHATHVASGNLEAGCVECFHFLRAQLGGQYAQLAGAFQKLWEAKPDEPTKCATCGVSLADHKPGASCGAPQPEAAPDDSAIAYLRERFVPLHARTHLRALVEQVADLKAQLAAARGETLGGQTLTRINRTLREQLQAANARVKELEARGALKMLLERAEKAERERDELHASLNLEADDRRCTEAERDAALKAKEGAEALLLAVDSRLDAARKQREGDIAEWRATTLAERKRADEAEAQVQKLSGDPARAVKAVGLPDNVASHLEAIRQEIEGAWKDRVDEAQAQAAALREALEWMVSAESDWENGETGVGFRFREHARHALSTDAGKPLLERMRRAEELLREANRWCEIPDSLEVDIRAFLADAAKEGTK
jgi:hypothetical protein